MAVHESWRMCVKSSWNHNAEYNHQHSQQWTKFHKRHEQQHKKLLLVGHGEDICMIIISILKTTKKSNQDVVFNFTSRTRLCHEQRTTSWTNHVKNDKVQGGSNMTGTDLYVNKSYCAAAVRPWQSEATTSTLPPARVRTCSVLSGSC